jgi:hypothetical protein
VLEILDLLLVEGQLNVYGGELEVRPLSAHGRVFEPTVVGVEQEKSLGRKNADCRARGELISKTAASGGSDSQASVSKTVVVGGTRRVFTALVCP